MQDKKTYLPSTDLVNEDLYILTRSYTRYTWDIWGGGGDVLSSSSLNQPLAVNLPTSSRYARYAHDSPVKLSRELEGGSHGWLKDPERSERSEVETVIFSH